MKNKLKFHFITKEDYFDNSSITLNIHTILSILEKNIKNILLNIRIIILLILNHDNMHL